MPIWAIVLLCIFMVVGSVVWVRPSPRDQKLAIWRRNALLAGLKVKLETLKAEPVNSGIRTDLEGISYILFNPAVDKLDKSGWAVVKAQGWLNEGLPEGWSWHTAAVAAKSAQVCALIDASPLPIVGLERTPYSARIIWGEPGTVFDAQVLKDFLKTVQDV